MTARRCKKLVFSVNVNWRKIGLLAKERLLHISPCEYSASSPQTGSIFCFFKQTGLVARRFFNQRAGKERSIGNDVEQGSATVDQGQIIWCQGK
jgi:hypothetical protein